MTLHYCMAIFPSHSPYFSSTWPSISFSYQQTNEIDVRSHTHTSWTMTLIDAAARNSIKATSKKKKKRFVYHCYDFASSKCIAFTLLFAAYVKEFYYSQLNVLRHIIILNFSLRLSSSIFSSHSQCPYGFSIHNVIL